MLFLSQIAHASAQQTIPDSIGCHRCRITMEAIWRLGDTDGPGALPDIPTAVTLDAQGRFWLTFFRNAPMVFDSDANFVAEVGRRGSGPGEYQYPNFSIAAGDSVAVFDRTRVTVVGPDLRPVRESQISNLLQVLDVRALAWPDVVVVNAPGRGIEFTGFPLHVIDLSGPAATIRSSFAVTERLLPNAPQYSLRRQLGVSTLVRAWVLEMSTYRLTRWDGGGRLQDHFLVASAWGPQPGVTYSYGAAETPPSPLLAGIHEDDRGRLWVIGRVASLEWRQIWADARERMPPPRSGASAVRASLLPREVDLYDTMIEVIDPLRRIVITRHRFEGHAVRFLRDGRLAVYRETEIGVPYIEIVELRIEGPD